MSVEDAKHHLTQLAANMSDEELLLLHSKSPFWEINVADIDCPQADTVSSLRVLENQFHSTFPEFVDSNQWIAGNFSSVNVRDLVRWSVKRTKETSAETALDDIRSYIEDRTFKVRYSELITKTISVTTVFAMALSYTAAQSCLLEICGTILMRW